ncbi:MAG: hypothetical protein IT329_02655 [Caldilineaceae bacterium]|nr:hypothetical protein [Caldilineaceae bacterium]
MTHVTIHGERFHLDGAPTYPGRSYRGMSIEGLLINSRMVQATFDDENPATRLRWAYPDSGVWDPERNVREFIDALPVYRAHGVLALTLNFQGGSPEGYSQDQPWENNAFTSQGEIKPAYLARMQGVLDRMDELGMVAILGVFYFGQDERLADEAAVVHALENVVRWVLGRGYRHVLLEVNNECDVARYEHPILTPPRVHELIAHAQTLTQDGQRLLVGASFRGNAIPTENVAALSDFLLLHGNGVRDPNRIAEMVDQTRALPAYRPMPILFNEDDHFDFDRPHNNFLAALSRYASWGYFDPGANNYRDGYQSVPVNWQLSTPRKQAFFALAQEITGRRQVGSGAEESSQ